MFFMVSFSESRRTLTCNQWVAKNYFQRETLF